MHRGTLAEGRDRTHGRHVDAHGYLTAKTNWRTVCPPMRQLRTPNGNVNSNNGNPSRRVRDHA